MENSFTLFFSSDKKSAKKNLPITVLWSIISQQRYSPWVHLGSSLVYSQSCTGFNWGVTLNHLIIQVPKTLVDTLNSILYLVYVNKLDKEVKLWI